MIVASKIWISKGTLSRGVIEENMIKSVRDLIFFLGNEAFRDLWAELRVVHQDWARYDHRPIMISLFEMSSRPIRRTRDFKFEEAWTSDSICREIIYEAGGWEEP